MVAVQENPRRSALIGGGTLGQPSEALAGIVANTQRSIEILTGNGDLIGARELQAGLDQLQANYESTGRIKTEPMDQASLLGNIAHFSTAGRVE